MVRERHSYAASRQRYTAFRWKISPDAALEQRDRPEPWNIRRQL